MTTPFRDIKADLMRRISAGEWPPGGTLPSEVELSAIYGSARATVGRALAELSDEGIVERRRRFGTRVRATPIRQMRLTIPLVRAEIEAQGAEYRYALVRSALVTPPQGVSARLGLLRGKKARHVLCLHLADGAPYQLEDRWISGIAVPAAYEADFAAEGPNEWLVRQVPYTDVDVAMYAVAADAEQAELLTCPPGAALFQIERQTFQDGQAVTLVRLTYREGHRMLTRY